MRKSILTTLTLLLFTISLVANSDLTSQYEKANLAYEAKDYSTSYEIYSKLYLSSLSDISLTFKLGRSAYESGHYEIALASFERVEMLDEGNLRNSLEMGRTYFMLKMYEDAEMIFQKVYDDEKTPPTVKSNIEIYIAKVKSAQQKSFTTLSLGYEAFYDSNVNYGSLDESYQIYTSIGELSLPTQEEIAGYGKQLFANISNLYDIGDKKSFAIRNSAIVFHKTHDDEKLEGYDITYFAYKPSLVYEVTKYSLELEISIDMLKLNKKAYTKTTHAKTIFSWNHTTSLKSRTSLKYAKKRYEETEDLDALHVELGYSLGYVLSPTSYTQTALTVLDVSKVIGNRNDVDLREYKIDTKYINQLNSTFNISLNMEYKDKQYRDKAKLFDSIREDKGLGVGATLLTNLTQTFKLTTKGQYNRVTSNQNIYGYEKSIFTIGLSKSF